MELSSNGVLVVYFDRILNTDFVSHGELVVQSVLERGELIEFQRKWRIHFLECAKPRFLPKLWSVDHNPR